jgi:UDP-glucose 4-epimerase
LKQALGGVDVVVHLAAKVSTPFASGDPHAFEQVNHWGTAELGYALEGSSVKKVIYASSASVYGLSDEPKTIKDTPNPNTSYGISKLNGEAMLRRLQKQMQVVVVRCANIYGFSPSIRFDAVINRFVRQAFFESRISIEGRGDQLRPFIHIRHAAEVFRRIVTDFSESGTYNLVDENRKIMDVANHLRDLKPTLETLFIEQDLPRTTLQVASCPEMIDLYSNPTSFSEQIQEFVTRFRFSVDG